MLTKEGFKRKLYIDYLEQIEEHARELFGADINLEESTPLGRWIRILAKLNAEQNETAEKIWNYSHIDDAEGVSLDFEAKKIGLSRIQAAKSVGEVTFNVSAISVIAPGVIVATKDGVEFVTKESIIDDGETGFARVKIEALQPGYEGDVPANTIVEINTPASGLDSVTNLEATSQGLNTETDTELRERYYRSLANAGGASIPSLEAVILAVPGVIDAVVDENDENVEVDGLPPHCIAPFVHGGVDSAIAQVVFSRKAGGIRSFGSTVVTVKDSKNKEFRIGFSRPVIVDVWVRLTIAKNESYPADGDDRVILRVIEHVGGMDGSGIKHTGQGAGADVVQYKILGALSDIPGIDDVSVELSKDGVLYEAVNIDVAKREIAQTQFDKVVIQ